ncbi:MAG TPA: ATP synthase F0 subunit A, partial [Polyangiaceae bacterium]|nr:ATP synthase F0 subunit A [Polyangiaceae bacterium]
MEHGSWFSYYFTALFSWVNGGGHSEAHGAAGEHAAEAWPGLMHYMGWPFNDEGQTWGLLGSTHDIAHNTGHGAEAFIHTFLVLIILTVMAVLVSGKLQDTKAALVPEDKFTLRTFFEIFVGGTYGLMKDVMGAKAAKYFLPLIGTCAFFILFSNAIGLVPGFLPPTSSMSVTLACGGIIFIATHIFGLKENGFNHIKHLFGPIIAWYALPLMLLIFAIEVISHLVRPMSLAIRLMANMFADHTVLGIFLGLSVMAGLKGFLLPVPVLLLGSLVVVVQALVFCLLATV